jgi:hypothetical protein
MVFPSLIWSVEISNTMRKSFNTLAVLMQCDGDTIRQ